VTPRLAEWRASCPVRRLRRRGGADVKAGIRLLNDWTRDPCAEIVSVKGGAPDV